MRESMKMMISDISTPKYNSDALEYSESALSAAVALRRSHNDGDRDDSGGKPDSPATTCRDRIFRLRIFLVAPSFRRFPLFFTHSAFCRWILLRFFAHFFDRAKRVLPASNFLFRPPLFHLYTRARAYTDRQPTSTRTDVERPPNAERNCNLQRIRVPPPSPPPPPPPPLPPSLPYSPSRLATTAMAEVEAKKTSPSRSVALRVPPSLLLVTRKISLYERA